MFWTDSSNAYIVHYIFSQYHSILLLREFYYWINKKRDHVENTQKKSDSWFLVVARGIWNVCIRLRSFWAQNTVFWDILRYLEILLIQAAIKANLLLRSFWGKCPYIWDSLRSYLRTMNNNSTRATSIFVPSMIHPSGTQHKTQKY